MPGIARVSLAGAPDQVTQRGNYGRVVFEDDEHRAVLKLLKQYRKR